MIESEYLTFEIINSKDESGGQYWRHVMESRSLVMLINIVKAKVETKYLCKQMSKSSNETQLIIGGKEQESDQTDLRGINTLDETYPPLMEKSESISMLQLKRICGSCFLQVVVRSYLVKTCQIFLVFKFFNITKLLMVMKVTLCKIRVRGF